MDDKPVSTAQQEAESGDSARSILSDDAYARAKELGEDVNEGPQGSKHLVKVMDEISEELQSLSGNKREYNAFLNVVAGETSHRPASDHHFELSNWNEATNTWDDVELVNEGRAKFMIVQPGDTLSGIENQYQPNGVLLPEPYMDILARGNDIKDKNQIDVGQSIELFPKEYFEDLAKWQPG